ncbi:MAG TPA: hypothetical protein VF759_11990 [Allosphingosinicella sp.]|jgi:hypothetical protein
MANDKLIKSILSFGKLALPLLGNKGTQAEAVLKALQQLLKDAKAAAGPADAKDLDALQVKVNAKTDKVIDDLRGTGGGG